ncbi:MAG: chemotaxis protein CheB, partial [Anaerolineae bacterium]|nr:chemotaxis protein CheB [Anaerolineae bacterium]
MSDASKKRQTFEDPTAADLQTQPLYIVGLGASAGGLTALEQFFQSVPTDSGLTFIVVQHLSPDFKSLMDELLAKQTSITIRQIVDDTPIEPNTIYLAPPRKNLLLEKKRLYLVDPEPHPKLFLPIDAFFRTLAEHSGKQAIAVVLSGAGSDGTEGIKHISRAGGLVLAQEAASAKFDAMPLNAQATGLVDWVLPPQRMPQNI